MLRTDWVYVTSPAGKEYSLTDLILAMAEANQDIFRSDLFKTLIAGFWSQFYWNLIFMGLVPFMIYFAVVLVFYSYHLGVEGEEASGYEGEETFLPYSILNMAGYTMITELFALYKQGAQYFRSKSNLIDSASLFINISIVINQHWDVNIYSDHFQRALASIGMMLMYLKLFY